MIQGVKRKATAQLGAAVRSVATQTKTPPQDKATQTYDIWPTGAAGASQQQLQQAWGSPYQAAHAAHLQQQQQPQLSIQHSGQMQQHGITSTDLPAMQRQDQTAVAEQQRQPGVLHATPQVSGTADVAARSEPAAHVVRSLFVSPVTPAVHDASAPMLPHTVGGASTRTPGFGALAAQRQPMAAEELGPLEWPVLPTAEPPIYLSPMKAYAAEQTTTRAAAAAAARAKKVQLQPSPFGETAVHAGVAGTSYVGKENTYDASHPHPETATMYGGVYGATMANRAAPAVPAANRAMQQPTPAAAQWLNTPPDRSRIMSAAQQPCHTNTGNGNAAMPPARLSAAQGGAFSMPPARSYSPPASPAAVAAAALASAGQVPIPSRFYPPSARKAVAQVRQAVAAAAASPPLQGPVILVPSASPAAPGAYSMSMPVAAAPIPYPASAAGIRSALATASAQAVLHPAVGGTPAVAARQIPQGSHLYRPEAMPVGTGLLPAHTRPSAAAAAMSRAVGGEQVPPDLAPVQQEPAAHVPAAPATTMPEMMQRFLQG